MTLKLYTSRYQNGVRIKESGLGAVCISLGFPKWPLSYPIVHSAPELMPSWDFLKLPLDQYRPLYLKKLEKMGASYLIDTLEAVATRKKLPGLVLLCYEDLNKPGEWCHRRLLAEWVQQKLGMEIPELEGQIHKAKPEPPPKPEPLWTQPGLF